MWRIRPTTRPAPVSLATINDDRATGLAPLALGTSSAVAPSALSAARRRSRAPAVRENYVVAGDELGPWDPMRPHEAAAEFEKWEVSWWVAGGWAIDLLVGLPSRAHGDLDVLVLRRDQLAIREHLSGWDVHAADPPGSLRAWPAGEILPPTVHDIWCRRTASSPWAFQLMIDDTEGDDWLFRRDRRIRRPIHSLAGPASTEALPVLSPYIQLLYKSKGLREKDQADFQIALPKLTDGERQWLRAALATVSPQHPWISEL